MTLIPFLLKRGLGALRRATANRLPKPAPPTARKLVADPSPAPSQIELILAERANIHRQIGDAARQGKVPDALVRLLYDNHGVGLTNDLNQLEELEQQFGAVCRRLDALFPEALPPEPEPEPEEPVSPPRHFQRLGSLFAERDQPTLQ